MSRNRQPQLAKEFQTEAEWSHGLCGCCEDYGTCCKIIFCPWTNCIAIDTAIGVKCFQNLLKKFLKSTLKVEKKRILS